jgi:PAS domain S-box-containing protein
MRSSMEAERGRALTRRLEDATLFRLLVDRVLDYAIFALTPDGHVATWNQGAERLKGYAAHEIIGQSFMRFYTEEDRAVGRPAQLLAVARTEGRVEDEGWRVRKDGSRFWADVVITTLKDDRGHLIGYAKVTRDLTERRQAEHDRAARLAAERAAERIERLQVATAALAAASRPAHAAEILIDVGIRTLGAAAGAVAVPTPNGAALEVLGVRGYEPHLLKPQQQLSMDAPYAMTYAWHSHQPVFVASREQVQEAHPELLSVVADSPFSAWAAIPLRIEQRMLGILVLSFAEPRSLDADERGFLLALGEVGAQAIDRARLYESERSARAEAEAAVAAQDKFLSVAAHELRTPVATVKAAAQLADRSIARGKLDLARFMRHMASINRSADRLGALIEDLLDVSRLRTGQLRLRRVQVELGLLVQETVGRYSATERGHRFTLSAPTEQVRVDADPLRLEQVLDNLLSNAVKYSPHGGSVEVRLCPDADGVTLTVTDHGIGLPVGQEARIFEAFGRGSNATARQIQGLGLGLAISRQLVEVHGGRIWATSAGEGQGTTLGVWLPVVRPGAAE